MSHYRVLYTANKMSDEMHYRYDSKSSQYVECSAEEAWDREGSMELGPAYIPPEKRLLSDKGSRFDHLNDLLDFLNDGLTAVTNSLARYENTNDDLRKKRLEHAVSLVIIYRDQLGNIDGNKWALNNTLDKCVPERGVLEGIRKARIEALKTGVTQKSLPPEDPDLQGVG
jgi:hypothetical protein